MKNILDMLIDYSLSRRLIDSFFIDYVIATKKREKNLEDFLNKTNYKIFKELSFFSAIPLLYEDNKRDINVYWLDIYRYLFHLRKNFNKKRPEYYIARNLFILYLLLHEIEHAYQLKTSLSEHNDFITLLYKTYFFVSNRAQNIISTESKSLDEINDAIEDIETMTQLKDRLYDISPIERLANINALKEVIEMLANIPKYAKTKELFNYLITKEYLKGYDFHSEVSAPTLKFLLGYQNEPWKVQNPFLLETYQNSLSIIQTGKIEECTTLGLPINKEDYIKIRERLPKGYTI